MTTSILDTIKQLRGMTPEYTAFDNQLIVYINTAFSILLNLGIGPSEGFCITGSSEKWEDFCEDKRELDSVQSYIALKVQLLFDPPTSSSAIESTERLLSEIEWRLYSVSNDS